MEKGSNNSRNKLGGIGFSSAEDNAVNRINQVAKGVYDVNRKIGKIVDELVEEKGGAKYGENTLGRLARHPTLNFSVEHLRRCWQYHRLLVLYGKDLKKFEQSLTYSHRYQISRLLDIEDGEVQSQAVIAMATKAVDDKLTVTALQNAVTTHLKSIGRTIICKPDKDGTKEVPEADIYEALIDTSDTVVRSAQKITDEPGIEHIAELRTATRQLGLAYVQLAKKLVNVGDEDGTADAKQVSQSLAAVLESMTDSKGGHNNDSK